jgi:hypothetical protein
MEKYKQHFETYCIDFYEGNLVESEKIAFLRFLDQHPDLKNEFQAFENVFIAPDDTVFPIKDQLKKIESSKSRSISTDNFEEYCIAYYEGDLSVEEQKIMNEYIHKHPAKKHIFTAYQHTRILPELHLKMPDKDSLKRTHVLNVSYRKMILFTTSIAASILLVFTVFSDLFNHSVTEYTAHKIQGSSLNTSQLFGQVEASTKPEYTSNALIANHPAHSVISREQKHTDIHLLEIIQVSSIYRLPENVFPTEMNISEYTDIYHAIALRHSSNDASYFANANLREFSGIVYTVDNFRDILQNTVNAVNDKVFGVNGWQLAKIGVTGINMITNSNIQFHYKTDEDGKAKKLVLNEFAMPLGRE